MAVNPIQPVFYIPHGGGPCFFMEWTMGPADTWEAMAHWLSSISATLPQKPDSILVISAHWETTKLSVTSSERPPLIYDYYGFPPNTYQLKYPAPGNAKLADTITALFEERDIEVHQEDERGLDHGVFIPFKLIYPDAAIPIVQLSLLSGLDPATHIQIGDVIQSLREQGVLIVGSGLSSHNLEAMMRISGDLEGSAEFNQWLVNICSAKPELRNKQLIDWESAPAARQVHPREEHLLPLMVAAGAAGDDRGRCVFKDKVLGATAVAIRFG